MADNYSGIANKADPGSRHFAITPSDTVDMAIVPRCIYCNAAGTVQVQDKFGTTLAYAMSAGQILPFRGTRILATGTTATVYGWE